MHEKTKNIENKIEVVVIGAGASGLMCAIEAAKRGRRLLVIDHANKVGKKILMSGGGRCNFTNLYSSHENFESHNPNFCKSALSRYTQWDFIRLVNDYQLAYHEKTLGQLFCDHKSKDIVEILLKECERLGVKIQLKTTVEKLEKVGEGFSLKTTIGDLKAESVVVATGGLSIPSMGATGFGYKIAEQFGLAVLPTSAGLVPFALDEKDKKRFAEISGVSVDSLVSNDRISFRENILFTHRGMSGPAILQISSYWQLGETVNINLLPDLNLLEHLKVLQKKKPTTKIKTVLESFLPKRLVSVFLDELICQKTLADSGNKVFEQLANQLQNWVLKPCGTEGYRTAEVTLGGVDCNELSSKTFEANNVKGLYFIGEVIDVTGWLGGYNFQWAWSSGWGAGQVA